MAFHVALGPASLIICVVAWVSVLGPRQLRKPSQVTALEAHLHRHARNHRTTHAKPCCAVVCPLSDGGCACRGCRTVRAVVEALCCSRHRVRWSRHVAGYRASVLTLHCVPCIDRLGERYTGSARTAASSSWHRRPAQALVVTTTLGQVINGVCCVWLCLCGVWLCLCGVWLCLWLCVHGV